MKNRSILVLLLVGILCLGIAGCGKEKPDPEISDVKNICELATLETYYHNVVESSNNKNTWFTGYKCWLEYEGIAKIGIDISKLDMDVKGNKITISIPKAEVLSTNLDEDKCKIAANTEGTFTSGADIDAMIKEAQKNMEQDVKNNDALLQQGEDRAKELLGNYIKSFGKINGKEYTIEWKEIKE